MKITLSAQGISLEVEVSDYKAITVYRGLAEKLLTHAGKTEIADVSVVKMNPEKVKTLDVAEIVRSAITTDMPHGIKPMPTPVLLPQEDDKNILEESAGENPPPQELDMTDKPKGYKGFLMIRCKGCGHVSTFCSKYELNWHKCKECGEKIVLENLRGLFANCECGQRAHYYTNVDDPVAEVSCVTCGAPVPVEWNPKKKCYQTIAERQI